MPQDFDTFATALCQTSLPQHIQGDFSIAFKPLQVTHIDGNEINSVPGVVESAFGQSPMQWHLPTFKTFTDSATRTSPLTLVTPATGFAQSATFTTSKTLFAVFGSRLGF